MPNNLCILFKYENILTIALNLTFFGHPLHNITAVSYNGPPLLSLHCHIMDPSTVIGPLYILSLQYHIMDHPDRLWTPLHNITAVSYNGPS